MVPKAATSPCRGFVHVTMRRRLWAGAPRVHAPRLVDQASQKSDASPGAMQLGEGFLIKEGGRGHGENLSQVESKVCFSPPSS